MGSTRMLGCVLGFHLFGLSSLSSRFLIFGRACRSFLQQSLKLITDGLASSGSLDVECLIESRSDGLVTTVVVTRQAIPGTGSFR